MGQRGIERRKKPPFRYGAQAYPSLVTPTSLTPRPRPPCPFLCAPSRLRQAHRRMHCLDVKVVCAMAYTRRMHVPSLPPRGSFAHMLALSLSLHVAVLMGVPVAQVQPSWLTPPVMVRLEASLTNVRAPEESVPSTESASSPRISPPENREFTGTLPDARVTLSPAAPPAHDHTAQEMAPPPPTAPAPVLFPSASPTVSEDDPAPPAPIAAPTPPAPIAVPAPSISATLPDAGLPAPIDPHWYPPRQLDRPPRGLATIRPDYPQEARRQGIEGHVRLRLRIDEEGRVHAAEVLDSAPPGVFDMAALAAFQSARYTPALRNGRPVRAEIELRVLFKLE